jgi:hypothetical protein
MPHKRMPVEARTGNLARSNVTAGAAAAPTRPNNGAKNANGRRPSLPSASHLMLKFTGRYPGASGDGSAAAATLASD